MGLKRNVSLMEGLRYQGKGPMLTFILHRIGGLGIVIFVGLHVLASFLSTQAWGTSAGILINSIYEHWLFRSSSSSVSSSMPSTACGLSSWTSGRS